HQSFIRFLIGSRVPIAYFFALGVGFHVINVVRTQSRKSFLICSNSTLHFIFHDVLVFLFNYLQKLFVMLHLFLTGNQGVMPETSFQFVYDHKRVYVVFIWVSNNCIGYLILNVPRTNPTHSFIRRLTLKFNYVVFRKTRESFAIVELKFL